VVLSSLSFFPLFPDEVLVVGGSGRAATLTGFSLAAIAVASAPAVFDGDGGLAEELAAAVVPLLAGAVVGLPPAGVVACCTQLRARLTGLPFAGFAFPACAVALPVAVFALPVGDGVFAAVVVVAVSVPLPAEAADGCGVPLVMGLEFTGSVFASAGGDAPDAVGEKPFGAGLDASGGGLTGEGDEGSAVAVLASSRAAKDCVLGSCVAAAACCHCDEARERAIPTSDAILDTVRPNAKTDGCRPTCNPRATAGHEEVSVISIGCPGAAKPAGGSLCVRSAILAAFAPRVSPAGRANDRGGAGVLRL
jgi:hypothetical protein